MSYYPFSTHISRGSQTMSPSRRTLTGMMGTPMIVTHGFFTVPGPCPGTISPSGAEVKHLLLYRLVPVYWSFTRVVKRFRTRKWESYYRYRDELFVSWENFPYNNGNTNEIVGVCINFFLQFLWLCVITKTVYNRIHLVKSDTPINSRYSIVKNLLVYKIFSP